MYFLILSPNLFHGPSHLSPFFLPALHPTSSDLEGQFLVSWSDFWARRVGIHFYFLWKVGWGRKTTSRKTVHHCSKLFNFKFAIKPTPVCFHFTSSILGKQISPLEGYRRKWSSNLVM